MVAAWLPYDGAGPAAAVLVQVAETLNKRHRLAWEMVASVVLPQLLLIAMACAGRGLVRRLPRAAAARSACAARCPTARTWT